LCCRQTRQQAQQAQEVAPACLGLQYKGNQHQYKHTPAYPAACSTAVPCHKTYHAIILLLRPQDEALGRGAGPERRYPFRRSQGALHRRWLMVQLHLHEPRVK
jgi:hypothetical protein